jgi:hypothetical protein
MLTKTFLLTARAGLIALTVTMAALSGCMVSDSGGGRGYRRGPAVQVQTAVVYQDDYDYYPGYETYYSRTRHEFVYRDGNSWVRRPAPQGVRADVVLAAPSVRVDFHDSPAQHHSSVVKSYPRNWKQPAKAPAPKDPRKDDRKDDRKPGQNRD